MEEEMKMESAEKKSRRKKLPKAEKKSRKVGFNFLDAVIIAMVLAIVLLVVLVYSPGRVGGTGGKDTNLIYTVRISGVSADYATAISVGEQISDENGYYLGTVASDVEVEPYMVYEYVSKADGNGMIVSVKHPDLVNLIVTITAQAELEEDGYYVEGKRIAVEREYTLILPRFESKGVCIAISEEQINEGGAN